MNRGGFLKYVICGTLLLLGVLPAWSQSRSRASELEAYCNTHIRQYFQGPSGLTVTESYLREICHDRRNQQAISQPDFGRCFSVISRIEPDASAMVYCRENESRRLILNPSFPICAQRIRSVSGLNLFSCLRVDSLSAVMSSGFQSCVSKARQLHIPEAQCANRSYQENIVNPGFESCHNLVGAAVSFRLCDASAIQAVALPRFENCFNRLKELDERLSHLAWRTPFLNAILGCNTPAKIEGVLTSSFENCADHLSEAEYNNYGHYRCVYPITSNRGRTVSHMESLCVNFFNHWGDRNSSSRCSNSEFLQLFAHPAFTYCYGQYTSGVRGLDCYSQEGLNAVCRGPLQELDSCQPYLPQRSEESTSGAGSGVRLGH